jgi:hypothetical protein
MQRVKTRKLKRKLYFRMDYFGLSFKLFFLLSLICLTQFTFHNTRSHATHESIKAFLDLYHQFIIFTNSYPAFFGNISLYFFFVLLIAFSVVEFVLFIIGSFVYVDTDNEFEYHPQIKYLL